RRALAAARVQRAVEVAGARVVPIGFGMTEKAQGFQESLSLVTGKAETPEPTRCKASSNDNRVTGAPGGKAVSRREGKAEDSTTKCPRSSGLRISRPKACASRARMMPSS